MSLEDTRPIVSTTTADTHPAVIGFDLCHLLSEHPDIELASIRLIREGDGVHIVGRVGKLAAAPEPECPHCHAHGTHDHTDYCCTLWPEYVCPHRLQGEAGPELVVALPAGYGHRLVPSDTLTPGVDLVGALGTAIDRARKRTARPLAPGGSLWLPPADPLDGQEDEPDWIDDGCRCPTRDNHQPGCPTLGDD